MQRTTMDDLSENGAKRHAPATLRNRDAITQVLTRELPQAGIVLEVASGSGEHAVFFAERFAQLVWQPSDSDPEALASIAAYHAEYEGKNLLAPIAVDAASDEWPIDQADAILCINMTHISPWAASEGLFAGAARILGGKDLPLILYGPYFEQGCEAAPSNLAFDESLKARNPAWGIRSIEDVDALAAQNGFGRTAKHAMPANNLTLVYRRI